jgi:hypothetical protein
MNHLPAQQKAFDSPSQMALRQKLSSIECNLYRCAIAALQIANWLLQSCEYRLWATHLVLNPVGLLPSTMVSSRFGDMHHVPDDQRADHDVAGRADVGAHFLIAPA